MVNTTESILTTVTTMVVMLPFIVADGNSVGNRGGNADVNKTVIEIIVITILVIRVPMLRLGGEGRDIRCP